VSPTRRRAAGPLTVALALLVAPLGPEAQAPSKLWRVGVLTGSVPRLSAPFRALEQRLGELGYVEGRNLAIEFRTASGRAERLPALAAELIVLRPDVLVVASTQAVMAAKGATQTIPIVLAGTGDPLGTGIVPSLARPGGNITGASLLNVELSGKGLQLLKEAVPSATRVAVLWNSGNQLHSGIRAATEAAAATLKVRTDMLDVRGPDDLSRAFEAMGRGRPDGLLVFPDSVTLAHRKPILEFAAGRRLPAMYAFIEMVEEGGLMCYGPSLAENFRQAADYVDKILKGAKPGGLPIAQATKFDLVINLRTAKTLGLSIPQSLALRADHVIQ
jgi:putative tryptophan/tyrosine transport system substrate-binding protein